MSTRKKRPVLFEVRRRGPVSGWKPRNSVAVQQILDATAARAGSPIPDEAGAPESVLYDPARGGMEVTLRWPALALVGAAALLMMLLSFYFGQQFGRARAPRENLPLDGREAALKAPSRGGGEGVASIQSAPRWTEPDAPLVPGRGSGAGGTPPDARPGAADSTEPPKAPDAPVFEAQRGMYYIVIQHFPKGHRTDAERAGAFLKANGIDCALLTGADLRLIATDAFDRDNKNAETRKRELQRIEGLKRQVRELGKQYARDGGYAFDQPSAQKLAD